MTERQIDLAYQAPNVHELGCHLIAETTGRYRERGVHVRLVSAAEAGEPTVTVACGGAVLSSALGRASHRLVFVACARPMFFVHGNEPLALHELRGQTVASFPAPSPPAAFLRASLRAAGLDPARDVELLSLTTDERVAALRSGRVVAALFGSDLAPGDDRLNEWHLIADLGQHVQFPTTGLAVPTGVPRDDVDALVGAHREALAILHADPARAADMIGSALGLDEARRRALAADLPARFTEFGTVDASAIQRDVDRVLAEVEGAAPTSIQQLTDVNIPLS